MQECDLEPSPKKKDLVQNCCLFKDTSTSMQCPQTSGLVEVSSTEAKQFNPSSPACSRWPTQEKRLGQEVGQEECLREQAARQSNQFHGIYVQQCLEHMQECCAEEFEYKNLQMHCLWKCRPTSVAEASGTEVKMPEETVPPTTTCSSRPMQEKCDRQESEHEERLFEKMAKLLSQGTATPRKNTYACIHCSKFCGKWWQCLQHMQECCPGELLKKKSLLQECCFVKSTAAFVHCKQKPVLEEATRLETKDTYVCIRCLKLCGKWGKCLEHMQECCPEELAYKPKVVLQEHCLSKGTQSSVQCPPAPGSEETTASMPGSSSGPLQEEHEKQEGDQEECLQDKVAKLLSQLDSTLPSKEVPPAQHGVETPQIQKHRYACISCSKVCGQWKHCLCHMQACCPHEIPKQKKDRILLMQRCRLFRDAAASAQCRQKPGPAEDIPKQKNDQTWLMHRCRLFGDAAASARCRQKPVPAEDIPTEVRQSQKPLPKKTYVCIRCLEVYGKWKKCLNHMRRCCPGELASKENTAPQEACLFQREWTPVQCSQKCAPARKKNMYACISCSNVCGKWKQCLKHMQKCCPGETSKMKKGLLQQRCRLFKGTEASVQHQQKPGLAEDTRTEAKRSPQPVPKNKYACISCLKICGTWSNCLVHMRECCPGEIPKGSKTVLQERCSLKGIRTSVESPQKRAWAKAFGTEVKRSKETMSSSPGCSSRPTQEERKRREGKREEWPHGRMVEQPNQLECVFPSGKVFSAQRGLGSGTATCVQNQQNCGLQEATHTELSEQSEETNGRDICVHPLFEKLG